MAQETHRSTGHVALLLVLSKTNNTRVDGSQHPARHYRFRLRLHYSTLDLGLEQSREE